MITIKNRMKKIVSVRFRDGGKVYDFECGAFVLKIGDYVIVETEKGLGLGLVYNAIEIEDNTKLNKNLKKIFRKADENDLKQLSKNRELEKQAHSYCNDSIEKLGLKMNLFMVESTFDTSRFTFFFTAENRVDFRQLVKTLVKKFRARIEMRQVGVRNQAKICGGIGRCGQVLCCTSFINKFEPISIKMAKRQGLSLNPTKISGQCGRLMCCLTFEDKVYKEIKAQLPKIGKIIKTSNVTGKVVHHNVTRHSITVETNEGTEIDVTLDEIVNNKRR